LIDETRGVVRERVAGIDLDDVMNQQHLHDAEHVDRRVAVLGKGHDEQAQRPGVLGVVFRSATVCVEGLPDDVFEPIALDEEGDLASEPLCCWHARILGQVRTTVPHCCRSQ
jgi:hypothetical protein